MLFTVIIATRNRPDLFRTALESVLAQDLDDFEVIVINDGSDQADKERYDEIEAEVGKRVELIHLARTERGHGQSYPLNVGVRAAKGEYLCFLDDDDQWIDTGHLQGAKNTIEASCNRVDLYLTNQDAYLDGDLISKTVWIGDMVERLQGSRQLDETGAYSVTVEDLLGSAGHCHVNTIVVRREFYLKIGGFDETIRWECDRDFYLRAIDRADVIKYCPRVVSRHNVPNPDENSSMTTVVNNLEKRLYQVRVLDKGILFSQNASLVAYCKLHKMYAIKKLSEELCQSRAYDLALYYGKEALLLRFNFKWFAFCLHLWLRGLMTHGRLGRQPLASSSDGESP